jgi:hypothetical protein
MKNKRLQRGVRDHGARAKEPRRKKLNPVEWDTDLPISWRIRFQIEDWEAKCRITAEI